MDIPLLLLPCPLFFFPIWLTSFYCSQISSCSYWNPYPSILLCEDAWRINRLHMAQGKPMIISTLVMALCVSGLKWGLLPAITNVPVFFTFCVLIAAGVAVYFVCLWFLDRGFVLQTRSLIKRGIGCIEKGARIN